MQAIEMRGAGLRLTERPIPEPGRGEIRVRVIACGANGSDWEFVTGKPFYGWLSRRLMRVHVPGSDVAGVVDALGPEVSGVSVGDRVVADTFESFGGFAEFCVAKAERWVPMPESMSFTEAASLPQSGSIAVTAFADLPAGSKVLVNGGGGGSGPYAIQLAKARGAEVWAVDNAVKQDVMRDAGADHLSDYRQTDFAELGVRFDYILDLVGSRPPRVIKRVLAPGGRCRMVGGPIGLLLVFALRGGLLMVKQGPDLVREVLAAVEAGTITPRVGAVAPLSEGAEALARMGRGEIAGKLVLTP